MSALAALTSQETGEIVTAQQAYDAFMSGPVLIAVPSGRFHSVLTMDWQDANGEKNDSSNVQGVAFTITDGSGSYQSKIVVGNYSEVQ